jgi:cytochrome c biogenesis protein
MTHSSVSFRVAVLDLASSMRFAISLLTVLAIASIVGTVLKQAEPYNNYIVQFGPYWFEVFEQLGLYDVYHAGWFLLILTFLVISTGLCVWRNTPLMLREMRGFREHATESSLAAFAHRAEFATRQPVDTLAAHASAYLTQAGFQARRRVLEDGVLLAAKAGSYHRLGYLLAHVAIVVICVGGLLDGNLVFKFQEWAGAKRAETRDIPQSQVGAISRMPPSNLSFRGSVTLPEGSSADVAFLNVKDGYLVQELPFLVRLKKFYIEHYSTGQPKRFASDVEILDRATGRVLRAATLEVNKPLIHDGIAIYQASFGDGGTRLKLRAWNLTQPDAAPRELDGVVSETAAIAGHTLEFTEFKPINVEDLGGPKTETKDRAMSVLGGNPAKRDNANVRNVGPSFQVKLRDARGQAREYHNYMLPIQAEGRWFLMSGMRASPSEPFRYARLPLDADSGIEGFMQLKAVLLDPRLHPELARRFARAARARMSPDLAAKLEESARAILGVFAQGGYAALGALIEARVPEKDREAAAEAYLKILEFSVNEAWRLARERAGRPAPVANEATGWFVRDSLNAVSDLFAYGAPVYLQLLSFDEVKASGLQLTRSPGKPIVYGGSILLTLGVFFMLYVRERRAWLLIRDGRALFAMSGNRKTIDFDTEFGKHRDALAALIQE